MASSCTSTSVAAVASAAAACARDWKAAAEAAAPRALGGCRSRGTGIGLPELVESIAGDGINK